MKTHEEHIARHKELHASLDELAADFIGETGALPSKTTLLSLMRWSHEQTVNPSDENGEYEKPADKCISCLNREGGGRFCGVEEMEIDGDVLICENYKQIIY